MSPKTSRLIKISILLLVAIALGFFIWLSIENLSSKSKGVACTMEAQLCPDGSSVGRTGPNCEFSTCPTATADETADWQTYKNEEYGFEITFPSEVADFKKVEKNLDSINAYNPIFEVNFAKNKNSIPFGEDEKIILASVFDKTKCNQPNLDSTEKEFCDFHKADNATGSWKTYDKNTKLIEFWLGNENYLISLGIMEGASDSETKTLISKLKVSLIDETVNWQTYKNKEYGFEFKYPRDGYEFHIGDPEIDKSMFFVKNSSKDIAKGPYINYAFDLNITPSFLRTDDPEIFQNPEEWASNQRELGIQYNKTTINGELVYTTDDSFIGDKLQDFILFRKRENDYDMYSFITKNDDLGEKILLTFKFTK
jgi:hypothetical protein